MEVARLCLEFLASGRFPAAPLIARHIMVGGEFVSSSNWAVPVFYTKDRKYEQAGMDLLAGVEKVLITMNLVRNVQLLRPLPLLAFSSRHMSTRDQNLRMISMSGSAWIIEDDSRYPKDFVMFWQSPLLDTAMTMKNATTFDDDELSTCPLSDEPWYIVYISAFSEYFIVFQRETNPAGILQVKAWKLDGKMTMDGSGEYELNSKRMEHIGRDGNDWHLVLNKTWWTPGTSLGCEVPRRSDQLFYPMILDLHCYPMEGSPPRRLQLIRCWTVPSYVHTAMCYPGSGDYDRNARGWKPIQRQWNGWS